jgi:shikimate dehydrogenase
MEGQGETALFGVLGYPVAHSLSPKIHGRFLERYGLDAVYVPIEVAPDGLSGWLTSLPESNFRGLNVTYPFKQIVARSLATLDDRARLVGAVNTLVRLPPGGEGLPYSGHNTDGEGFCLYLERELSFLLANKTVVVLGAGGAARSIVLSVLGRTPRRLVVVNRSSERFAEPFFRALAESSHPLTLATIRELGNGGLSKLFTHADLVVQATSFGLTGSTDPTAPWPVEELTGRALVVDINYRKGKPTPFLSRLPGGVVGHDGKGMLVYQAAEAFRLWWGHLPEVEGVLRSL